jgi:hypothetical protein
MNTPDPPRWTPNSCFALFGLFHYSTNWAELVQLMHKFVQPSHVKNFQNERTRSTPLDPKLMFGAFQIVSLLHELRYKTGRTGAIYAQVRATKSCWNFLQQMDLDHPHWNLNSCFGTFWTVSLLHESRGKTDWTGTVSAQVCATMSHWSFSQRAHLIHPIGSHTHV